jgi:hypothetical protein
MIGKIIFLVIFSVVGYVFIVKNREMVRAMGRSTWAEQKLGPGGSETMWKILGFIMIVIGLIVVTGGTTFFYNILRAIIRPGG